MKKASAQLLLNRLLDGVSAMQLLEFDVETFAAIQELRDEANAPERVDVYVWLGDNKKVDAIKTVRMVTGWGLKEAKEYVDRHDSYQRDRWIGPVTNVCAERYQDLWDRVEQEHGTAAITTRP